MSRVYELAELLQDAGFVITFKIGQLELVEHIVWGCMIKF
jgi:hypothetical protein